MTRWAENHSLWQSSGMWQGGYKSGDVSWLKQVPWIPFTKTFFWVIWWSSKSYFRICKETRSYVITINYWTFTISKSFPKNGWFLVKFRSIPGHPSVKSFYHGHFYVNLWFRKVYDNEKWSIQSCNVYDLAKLKIYDHSRKVYGHLLKIYDNNWIWSLEILLFLTKKTEIQSSLGR